MKSFQRIFVVAIFIILQQSLYGQKASLAEAKGDIESKTTLVKSGHGKFIDGVCKIQFDNPIDQSYAVIITPVGSPQQVYVAEKQNTFFVIRNKDDQEGEFDYCVFLTR